MPQKRQGFTTMVDLAEFEKTTWAFLVNIKMTWQYDGMAYLFREAGIPLYGIDRGTTKMNHPIAAMAIPMSKDKNYGVDIYVPADRKKKAASLIEDEEKLASLGLAKNAQLYFRDLGPQIAWKTVGYLYLFIHIFS